MTNVICRPLVSVIVHNFNYGKYLEECLTSVMAQTYENIEVLFSDNASTDNSWEIAQKFDKKYPNKFSLAKNRRNMGGHPNFKIWFSQLEGEYRLTLSSDDRLEPNFIEKAVNHLEKHRDCAFVMVHRSIIDQKNELCIEAPFFNQDCILYPPGLSLLYLKATINPSMSQILYRVPRSPHNIRAPLYEDGPLRQFFRHRIYDFYISLENPIIYLKEPLLQHREHQENHARYAEENLLDVLGAYSLIFEFIEYVRVRKPSYLDLFEKQISSAIEKHAETALRYSARFIEKKNHDLAFRYAQLSLSIAPQLRHSKSYKEIFDYLSAATEDKKNTEQLNITHLLTRTISYDPPDPFSPL